MVGEGGRLGGGRLRASGASGGVNRTKWLRVSTQLLLITATLGRLERDGAMSGG